MDKERQGPEFLLPYANSLKFSTFLDGNKTFFFDKIVIQWPPDNVVSNNVDFLFIWLTTRDGKVSWLL